MESFVQLSAQSNVFTKENFGGKATNLNEMIRRGGVNVPPGFVAGTRFCFGKDFSRANTGYGKGDMFGYYLSSHIRYLAQLTETAWASSNDVKPLIVSVRSGAPVSMPGMMDTILNIGLTRNNLKSFAKANNSSMAFALDCYRRLIQMYGTTVRGIPASKFNEVYDAATLFWSELTELSYAVIVDLYEKAYKEATGEDFPADPNIQLLEACNAVFKSWHSEKAINYRDIEGYSHTMGTAVTVQQMVFGNLNEHSATGVIFTHDPNTGIKGVYGDFLQNAQGEDVVAGTHKVSSIQDIVKHDTLSAAGKKLFKIVGEIYQMNRNILDIEFTIENGEVYILQYRKAKCSNRATIRSILDMTRGGEISAEDATSQFMELLPAVDKGSKDPGNLGFVGKGLGATENVVTGSIAVGHEQADAFFAEGVPYIYVANETAPDDIVQMKNAVGILTAKGGAVSHAVVVARAWSKTCVVGFSKLQINEDGFSINGEEYSNGSLIKINGATGEVWA